MKTLDAAFKEVFGEELKKYGFVKLKGRQPYFVRLIGDEIVQVITYINEWCEERGCKAFTILCGVATVYRERLTLDWSPKKNTDWLISLRQIYAYSTYPNIDKEYSKSIDSFIYRDGDEASIYNALNNSFDYTEKLILPVLDDIVDLKSCVSYFNKYNMRTILFDVEDEFGKNDGLSYCNEGLITFLVYDVDEYKKIESEKCEEAIKIIKNSLQISYKETLSRLDEDIRIIQEKKYKEELGRNIDLHRNSYMEQVNIFNSIKNDYKKMKKVQIELKKRKQKSVIMLKKYELIRGTR